LQQNVDGWSAARTSAHDSEQFGGNPMPRMEREHGIREFDRGRFKEQKPIEGTSRELSPISGGIVDLVGPDLSGKLHERLFKTPSKPVYSQLIQRRHLVHLLPDVRSLALGPVGP
jgi:hypothetical protein